MAQAKKGDKVKVHYVCKSSDGEVFDNSYDRKQPLEFTIGEGQVIAGFDQAVTGLNPGDELSVDVPADQAYGSRREDMIVKVERSRFDPAVTPTVGQIWQMTHESGNIVPATVIAIDDEIVTMDANHPLAGKDLVFDIKLVEIV